MCIEIHTRGAIFRPHLNSDPININTNLNPNPNPNYPNHSYTPRVENSLEQIQLSVPADA